MSTKPVSVITKPMLAASLEDSKGNEMTTADLTYPLGASIKLDGIRCLRIGQQTLSRSFKLIPNKHVQSCMAALYVHNNLDGELITYNKDGSTRTFNEIQGDIMRESGTPDFKFQIFDYVQWNLDRPYMERMADLKEIIDAGCLPSFCEPVYPTVINNKEELNAFLAAAVAAGHEGVMTRSLKGGYKCGRATFKSQDLIKIKPFEDSEAEIIGFEEKMHNANEATVDELGHTKRSSSKDGLVPAGTLGTLLARDIHDNREFGIGTFKTLKKEDLQEIWNNRDKYLGKIVNYRYQKVGSKDLPRIPSFRGFRDPRDMS